MTRVKNASVLAPAIALLAFCAGLVLFPAAAAAGEKAKVRRPAVAGAWYPADKTELAKLVEGYLAKVPEANLGRVVALISPHAGYVYCGQCAAYGYKAVGTGRYRRAIVMGPAHRFPLRGASVPSYTHYRTPLGLVELDTEACRALLEKKLFQSVNQAHDLEHSLESQIPFLQKVIGDFKLVPILVGEVDAEGIKRIAAALGPYLDEETLVVVSSDFTHSGSRSPYNPFKENIKEGLRQVNLQAAEEIISLDPARFSRFLGQTGATICGRYPILILMELLQERKNTLEGRLLDYRTSGDITADYREYCVAYESIVFYEEQKDAASNPGAKGAGKMLSKRARRRLLEIARKSVEAAVNGKPVPKFEAVERELNEKCGVFVTLKTDDQLRGCLGQFTSDLPLWKLVAQMAAASATEDPRFAGNRLRPEELGDINIEVSVLSPLKKLSDPLDFKLGEEGIYVMRGFRTGCFLPQVATETGWSKEEFLANCCLHKAGLSADAWKDKDAEVYSFEAEVIDEQEELSH